MRFIPAIVFCVFFVGTFGVLRIWDVASTAVAQDPSGDTELDPIPDPIIASDDPPPVEVTRPDQIVSITFHEAGVGRMGFSIQRANGDEDIDEHCGVSALVGILNGEETIKARAVAGLNACEESLPCDVQVDRLRQQISELRGEIIRLKALNQLENR